VSVFLFSAFSGGYLHLGLRKSTVDCGQKRSKNGDQRHNSFLVKETTLLSLTGNPIFSAIISKDASTITRAALSISSEASDLPLQMPLQFSAASGFSANKILLPLKSISLITNGSRRHMDGFTSWILHVFCSVKKMQLPSGFLRIERLLESFGSSRKSTKPFASMRCCSLGLMSAGWSLQQAPQPLH
jgi:hypothetical protein